MNPIILLLCWTIGLVILAGTFGLIRDHLVRRPLPHYRPWAITVFVVIERLLYAASGLAFISALPHPITIVLVFLFTASVITAMKLRYREESESLNRWIRTATRTGTSITDLLEAFADGSRSRLARQAKTCAVTMNRGVSIAEAARRFKLPITADTLAAISLTVPQNSEVTESESDARTFTQETSKSYQASQTNSLSVQRFVYVVATIVLAWITGYAIRATTIPRIQRIYFEFSDRSNAIPEILMWTVWIGNLFVIVLLAWLLLAFLIPRLPLGMIRWVPWFGQRAIDRWRCDVLRSILRGVTAGQSAATLFRFLETSTRRRWVRVRCGAASRLVQAGVPLPLAMKNASIITGPEQAWLTSAEQNGHLPTALQQMIGNLQRRQTLRWKIRMAWVVPLVTVLVGIYVLMHAIYVFTFVSNSINHMS